MVVKFLAATSLTFKCIRPVLSVLFIVSISVRLCFITDMAEDEHLPCTQTLEHE